MPTRRKIPLMNDTFYHIYNKVMESKTLFTREDDYYYFLKLWNEIDFTSCCRIFAYCLMPTHYHFLLQITDAILFPRKMSYLLNKYLQNIIAWYDLKGPFFRDRFKTKVVQKENYLIYLCCYIHLNPLKAKLVKSLDDWPFSNYLEFVGKRQGSLFDQEFYRQYINSPTEYEKFIQESYDEKELGDFID